ncbi:MAG: hypothetical protein ABH863_05560 [Candidatus Micrarchaeota archaeon]
MDEVLKTRGVLERALRLTDREIVDKMPSSRQGKDKPSHIKTTFAVIRGKLMATHEMYVGTAQAGNRIQALTGDPKGTGVLNVPPLIRGLLEKNNIIPHSVEYDMGDLTVRHVVPMDQLAKFFRQQAIKRNKRR